MIYPQNYEAKLGFDQIRQILKSLCTSPLGMEKVDEIAFLDKQEDIEKELSYGEEFYRILQQELHFPDWQAFDLRHCLQRIRIVGTWMDESELFDLKRTLDSLQRVVGFFVKDDKESASPYPYLQAAAQDTATFPQVLRDIDRILDKFGHIQDYASPALASIRKKLSINTAGVSRKLHILLKQAQDEGYVEKGLTPTMREGRLVIPVSPAFKRKIKGIVHEESASGKTVYIEPEELVEANNLIRELEAEEKREIIRILTEFTDSVRPLAEDIMQAHTFLGLVDFSQAKARWAQKTAAIKPIIENTCVIDWKQAMHPLLYLSLQKQGKEIVPLDIHLNKKERILLISGPNAGGKSVCLKTVGLLQYMLQCGLMIPLRENSLCGIFEHIFIDIGDEQSIENDLSTYSSHLLNIKYFLRHSNAKTLLLIDEFGTGTEPKIGGAIAQASLEELNRRRAFGVITTHYDNLKHFAEDQDGIINGAMLYDRHMMQALFRLEIGRPGSSFAVEIARKIGLPESIIAKASDLVGSDYIDMDKHLQDIVRDKRYWENKRQQVKQLEKNLSQLTEQYEEDLAQVKQERKEIIKQAKAEAKELLSQANAKIENTIRGIKESQAEKERTRELRKNLDQFKEDALSKAKEEAKIQARKERDKGRIRMPKSQEEKILRKLQRQQAEAKNGVHSPIEKAKASLQEGDMVHIKGQDSLGKIVEIKGKKALVEFGMMKTRIELEKLEKGKAPKETPTKHQSYQLLGERTSDQVHRISAHFRQEIDMRGMRADEALMTLQYYLDEAIVVGAKKVRILHGTGTGALRELVRQYVGSMPEVRHYHDEHIQLGGSGITVVEF